MKRSATLIKKLWKEAGETTPLRSKDPIGAINTSAAKYNSKRFTPQLRNNINLYDQFLIWLVELATLLLFEPTQNEQKRHASYRFFVGAICSLTMSIRHQIVVGHDVCAKILVRSLCEYVDVLLLLIKRPELVIEFEQQDFKKANEVWHRHVKSLKARGAIWTSSSVSSDWFTEWTNWRNQEDTVLSVAAHPSYVAAVMSVIPLHSKDLEHDKLWPRYLGCVTESSIRTLVYTMYILSVLAAFDRFPFGEEGVFKPLVVFDQKNEFHRLVKAGRHVLIGIVGFLSRDQDNPHFRASGPAWLKDE
jgi:hypothetical protein